MRRKQKISQESPQSLVQRNPVTFPWQAREVENSERQRSPWTKRNAGGAPEGNPALFETLHKDSCPLEEKSFIEEETKRGISRKSTPKRIIPLPRLPLERLAAPFSDERSASILQTPTGSGQVWIEALVPPATQQILEEEK